MRCEEFKTEFDRVEGTALPKEMSEHARTCPGCRSILSAQRKIDLSFEVIERSTPSVDLTARIMAKIAKEPARRPAEPSLFEKLIALFNGSGFMKPAFAVGVCGLLLFVMLSHSVPQVPPANNPASQGLWEMACLSGNPANLPAGAQAQGKSILLPIGEQVQLGENCRVAITLPGRGQATLENGSFIPLANGFFLLSGKAGVKVTKTTPDNPFTIGTPFADVAVIGTQFTLDVAEDGLNVKVTEGRVRVVHPTGNRELTPSQETTVGNSGFRVENATVNAASGTPVTNAGSIDSSTEGENPGK